MFASICHFLITQTMFVNILVMFVFLFCMFLLYFVHSLFLFCILFLFLYIAVSFLFLYKFTDHCHRVKTLLQKINIISYQNHKYCNISGYSHICILKCTQHCNS